MAESQAVLGLGTLIEARGGSGSEPYVSLGEVTGFTPPSDTVDEHEVSHLQSDDGRKEFIPGMSDPGTMSLTVNYIDGSDEDLFALAWKADRTKRDVRITYQSGRTQTIRAFVKSYVPNEITPNAPQTATLELRCTGASAWA